MGNHINLIKLSVGTENIACKTGKISRARKLRCSLRHITRMWPKRENEILSGGSIYWVIKGVILCRQPILRLDEYVSQDGFDVAIVCQPPNTGHARNAPFKAGGI